MTIPLKLQSNRTAAIDSLRQEHAGILTQVLGIAAFALLTAAAAHVRIYLWEVPITLQTAAVYGSGLFLGWRNGLLAQLVYLSIGLFLPVFAGGEVGLAYMFAAASAGYLLAFPLAAAVSGYLSQHWNTISGGTLSAVAGAAVLFLIGVTWLHFAAGHATWIESIDRGFLRFAAFDAAKILFVGGLYGLSRRVG